MTESSGPPLGLSVDPLLMITQALQAQGRQEINEFLGRNNTDQLPATLLNVRTLVDRIEELAKRVEALEKALSPGDSK